MTDDEQQAELIEECQVLVRSSNDFSGIVKQRNSIDEDMFDSVPWSPGFFEKNCLD